MDRISDLSMRRIALQSEPLQIAQAHTQLWRRIAWFWFLAVCLHLAFVQPDPSLIIGERAKLFSGLLALVSLLLAIVSRPDRMLCYRPYELWISVILSGLALFSAWFSATPGSSMARTFVVLSAGLGGFWCSRMLLDSASRQTTFMWFCMGLLGAILVAGVLGLLATGMIHSFVDDHHHPLESRILLLSFAPLALLLSGSRRKAFLGGAFLCCAYPFFMLLGRTGSESAVVIPLILCLIGAWFIPLSRRFLCAIVSVLFIMSAWAGYHLGNHQAHYAKDHVSVAYRIENIFFSSRTAMRNPFLGIGLWVPREQELADYTTTYPYITKERFVEWTKELRTSENMFLTLLADMGFPFVMIYGLAVTALMWTLARMCVRPPSEGCLHPLALALPLTGAIIHFQVFDGLMHPQVSWFFHILLGLVPMRPDLSQHARVNRNQLVIKAAAMMGAVIAGGLLGIGLPTWRLGQ